jgi:hypothetical protein
MSFTDLTGESGRQITDSVNNASSNWRSSNNSGCHSQIVKTGAVLHFKFAQELNYENKARGREGERQKYVM